MYAWKTCHDVRRVPQLQRTDVRFKLGPTVVQRNRSPRRCVRRTGRGSRDSFERKQQPIWYESTYTCPILFDRTLIIDAHVTNAMAIPTLSKLKSGRSFIMCSVLLRPY